MFQNKSKLVTFITFLCLFMSFQNCSKINFSAQQFAAGQGGPGSGPEVCGSESFTQPTAPITNSVDILFVSFANASFSSVRQTVVSGLNQFVAQLPAGSDYQVATMLGDNPASPLSGTLYAPAGSPVVLSSQTMTLNQIQTDLSNYLLNPPQPATGSGEEALASFYTSLDDTHLAKIRNQGFYRIKAALAVIFLANEADMCGLPETDPMTDNDWAQEIITKHKDCVGISPQSVLDRVRVVQNGNPFLLGTVTYTDINQKPLPNAEAEYGWGLMDIVKLVSGPAVDINSNIAAGLGNIGQLISQKLNLITDFVPAKNNLDPATITVAVDNQPVTFNYQAISNNIHLNQAGGAGSVVKISYCQK